MTQSQIRQIHTPRPPSHHRKALHQAVPAPSALENLATQCGITSKPGREQKLATLLAGQLTEEGFTLDLTARRGGERIDVDVYAEGRWCWAEVNVTPSFEIIRLAQARARSALIRMTLAARGELD